MDITISKMKSVFFTVVFSSFVCLALAQKSEVLKIQNDTSEIYLESLHVDIEVIGNIATTVTKMTFYNPNDRILEGELNFPLAERQNVFRFAMDVNGKLREGVAVEKNLGRRAFEGVVRQAIDPGLLEKTVGNNYKARVYPIPANGRKTILIGYEEELKNTTAPLYQLIMAFGKVKAFNLKIEVLNQQFEPKVKQNELATFSFKKWRSAFIAETKEKDFNASGILSFEIPTGIEEKVYVQESQESDFFYITLNPKVTKVEKEKPSSLAILWDVSRSSTKRDTSKEFDLIRNYLEILSNIDVHLIRFSNEIHDERNFQISEGNADELISFLSNSIYDGGTSYKSLRLHELDHDELLLFTDGISTLDRLNDFDKMHVTHVVNSSASSDSRFLRYLTRSTGGSYIDLLSATPEEATESLTHIEYQFINTSYDHRNIEEVYPSAPVTLKENAPFSITGKIKSTKPTSITLNFGMQGKVMESREVVISREVFSSSINRIWANKKVEELLERPESNQDVIVKLGKAYNLVTPFTSLIVLDRVEDYVTYGIEPPTELKSEYERLLTQQIQHQASNREKIIATLLDDYEDRLIWWKENQHDSSVHVPKVANANQPQNPENTDNEITIDQESDTGNEMHEENTTQENPDVVLVINQLGVDTTIYNRIIEGQVTDEQGEPLPGVNILIKGTTVGTIANLEGRYSIRVRENDILVISNIGYTAREMPIGANSALDIVLEEDIQYLSEVVVTALGVERVSRSLSYSISQIQGSTPGVQIESGNQGSLVIRGHSTVKVGPNPLYILDGEISSEEEVNWLQTDEIASTNVIKGENATSIYGSQASNGVIVIMTKDALEEELELPDSIITMFESDFVIKEWNPDEPYIDSLKTTPKNQQYELYLQFREQYGKAPSFYLTVGNFFTQSNREELGLRILSNIAELDLENHELLKILAHKYLQIGQFERSLFLFDKLVQLRPDELQSKRDLALAYQANKEYQKALDIFLEIILTEWNNFDERFPLIKSTVLYEMNNLISLHKWKLDLSSVPKELIIDLPVDIRIVLDWNTLETDLDLWIIEPNGEKCYYENALTKLGGRLTEDYMDGYGPEEYLLKNATPGEYKIEVNFYDERVQKISGPVTLQVSIFTKYGSKHQKKKEITMQLEGVEDVIEVGSFHWNE